MLLPVTISHNLAFIMRKQIVEKVEKSFKVVEGMR